VRKVYLRADASTAIGYGHFVRSVALAAMLRDDFECTIFTQTPSEFQVKETEGICKLAALPSGDDKFSGFLEMLEGSETVVLDNYFYSEEYISKINAKGCKTVLIQDFFGKDSCADAMLFPCRNPRYALLRKPFTDTEASREKDLWVVAIGATDPLGLTDFFRNNLLSEGKKVKTLSGGLSAREVAELFSKAEGVVCSASSVCYEALSCGCKVCAGWYVDNQQDFYSILCKRGLILPLGDLRTASLPDNFDGAPCNPGIRDSFMMAQKNCKALFHSLEMNPVEYTRLSAEQSRMVWEVRNRQDICRYMTNPNRFSFEEHLNFIENLKKRKDRLYYAFFRGEQLAGSIDLVDIVPGDSAERGLYVNPDFQGQGIARQMECLMDSKAAKMGLKTIKAEVLTDNNRSISFHKAMGYEPVREEGGMLYMQKLL